jgi:thymidylate synthase (FAD)|tara:strand:- start:2379 stop:3041 length:663 start_codon:yes stop_codon:yes gene_type:complete
MFSPHTVSLVWRTDEAERMIVRTARVSAPKNEDNMDTGPKLLRYLIKHGHWSPFEMANMCLEVHTTRTISPQILRHRSFSFQEFSQRYANTNEIGRPLIPHLRSQDLKNRQKSFDDLEERLGKPKVSEYYRRIGVLFEDAEHLYQEMLSDGIAKECARSVLPNAPTKMYMNGTLRSWLHYIDLRTANGTQEEHKEIAQKCKAIFMQQFPIISEAMWNTLC